MTAQELKTLVATDPGRVLVIDVREPDEVSVAPFFPIGTGYYVNFPIMQLLILPKEELVVRLEKMVGSVGGTLVNKRIVTVCHSGGRSARAERKLEECGIQAENLEGGYLAWEGE